MSVWSLRISRGRPFLLAGALLAALSKGAEPPAATLVALHPLVTATETLYQRKLPQATDELTKLTSMAPGLTDDDFIHLQFVTALRALDDGNELAARRAISQALQIDRSAEPPPFASRLGKMLEEARVQLPPGPPSKDRNSRLMAARKAASAREVAHKALLRAVDALYINLQIEGAEVTLELARSSVPLTPSDRAQVVLRHGVLRMELGDEDGARAAFREALEADRGASMPGYAPPKTLRIFEEVKAALAAAAKAPPPEGATSRTPQTLSTAAPGTGNVLVDGSRPWGLVAGGAGLALAAGGAVAGVVALTSLQAEQRASADGDYAAYLQSRDSSIAARTIANGLYGVGAVALGVGAYLFLRAPGGLSFGAGAEKGRASLVVGGHF